MDKVIVITGASAGIGAAMSHLLGTKGASLVLVARREDELKKVAADSGNALAVVADVTRRADVQRIVDEALGRFGRIDVWINNAGRAISRPAAELTDEDIDDMILINVKSVLYCVQAVLPHMKERHEGHIINVSSVLSRLPMASVRAGYSASKHALMSLTANLRVDLKPQGILVSSLIPGIVATDFGLNAKYGGPDNRQLPGAQPVEEVAEAALDLIEHPRAEAYSRPQYRPMVAGYFSAEDVATIEAGWRR